MLIALIVCLTVIGILGFALVACVQAMQANMRQMRACMIDLQRHNERLVDALVCEQGRQTQRIDSNNLAAAAMANGGRPQEKPFRIPTDTRDPGGWDVPTEGMEIGVDMPIGAGGGMGAG